MSNGFICDPVVVILHKFLAYCISGSEEANKVNTVELYLLECDLKKKKLCATTLLLSTFQLILRRTRCHPPLPQIDMAFATHFKLISPNDFTTTHQQDVLACVKIEFTELKGARLINTWTHLVA